MKLSSTTKKYFILLLVVCNFIGIEATKPLYDFSCVENLRRCETRHGIETGLFP